MRTNNQNSQLQNLKVAMFLTRFLLYLNKIYYSTGSTEDENNVASLWYYLKILKKGENIGWVFTGSFLCTVLVSGLNTWLWLFVFCTPATIEIHNSSISKQKINKKKRNFDWMIKITFVNSTHPYWIVMKFVFIFYLNGD